MPILLVGILLGAFLFSKEWIGFNEEALLILNFFLLFYLARRFLSETIEGVLDEHEELTHMMFKDFFWMERYNYRRLKEMYQRVSFNSNFLKPFVLSTASNYYKSLSIYNNKVESFFNFISYQTLLSLYQEEIQFLQQLFVRKTLKMKEALIRDLLTSSEENNFLIEEAVSKLERI